MKKTTAKHCLEGILCLVLLVLICACRGGEDDSSDPFRYVDSFGREQGNRQVIMAKTADGVRLKADVFYTSQESHKWAIVVHGLFGTRQKMEKVGRVFPYLSQGYNIIVVDQRGWGESSGFCTFGYNERNDVINWARTILAMDPEARIVLHGYSMGAATVLGASGLDTLPEEVEAIVADSAYIDTASLYNMMSYNGRANYMSLFETLGANCPEAFDVDESPLQAVKKAKVPILFLHGSEDRVVPLEFGRELYEAANCPKEFHIFYRYGHIKAAQQNGTVYWNVVFRFLQKHTDTVWEKDGLISARRSGNKRNLSAG